MEAKFRYWAFISYSHADRKWGDWLHHALETHRIPKPLVGQDTQRGEPVPPRVFPVFRDREELPTSANLGTVIGEALRESRYLIVICSPRAAQSRWVNQEILDYKRLGRGDRILALIVDGEPNAADGKPGYAAEMECFPEALKHPLGPDGELDKSRRTEPIAADARSDKDGKLNAKLKLLAGVLGVNYDDLKRRDEERRRRQQRLVLGVSGALVLVFAALAGAALWQWREAAAQRQATLATLSRSDFLQADHLINDGRRVEGLAYLVRSLTADPRNHAAVVQLGVQLANRNWLMPTLLLPRTQAHFSPNGRRVLAVGQDHSVQVWDLASGEPRTAPLTQAGAVRAARFSPDGKQLIVLTDAPAGGACKLSRLDAESGADVGALSLPDCLPVNSVSFSADGGRLAVISEDLNGLQIRAATVKVWDSASGRRLWTSPADQVIRATAQLSPDGRRLLTLSMHNTAEIWNLDTAQAVDLAVDRGEIITSALDFSPDSRRLALATESGTRVWDTDTGKPVTDLMYSGEQTDWVEFSPDGKRVATANAREQDGMARIWDAVTAKPLSEPLETHTDVYEAHFSPDGKRLLIVSGVAAGRWVNSSTMRIWDPATAKSVTESLTTQTPVGGAEFSPDGQRLLTMDGDDSRVWEWLPGQQPVVFTGDDTGQLAAFSPDGSRIATTSDKGLAVWDAARGVSLAEVPEDLSGMGEIHFGPGGKRVVAVPYPNVTFSSTVRIFVVDSRQEVRDPLQLHLAPIGPTPRIDAGATRFVAVLADDPHSARVYALDGGKPVSPPLTSAGRVLFNDFSPDGRLVVTAADDKTARIWDAAGGQPLTPPLQHSDKVVSAAFSPDNRRLATGANDSSLRIWDVQSGKLLAGPFKQGLFPAFVCFSPDGERLVSYSDDGEVRLWDAHDGHSLLEPILAGDAFPLPTFSPDGRLLLTDTGAVAAALWDVDSGEFVGDLMDQAGFDAHFSPDGKQVLTDSGRLYALPPPQAMPPWLLTLASAVAGQTLNARGVLQPGDPNSARTLTRIREELKQAPDDDWTRWGRWFLADPATRSVSPFSQMVQPASAGDRGKPGATLPPATATH